MIRYLAAFAVASSLLAAGPAGAASPHDGDWVAVVSKEPGSTIEPGFKLVINFKFGDNKLTYHSENTTRPDKPYISDHVTTLDGTVAPFPNQERFNQVAITQTDPDNLQILKMKDGDVVAGEFWTFSADGKTAVRRGVAKNPEGKSHAYQEHFVHR
ncbi:MAG: hypothetical protein JF588_00690 [Caulobacterales bacterium]|nr:hypothetical protein [Caulobacterales bacterium]